MDAEFTNLAVAHTSGGDMDDFQERVNPHELKDDMRKQWIVDLWTEFVELARNGVVTLFDAKRIAEDLRVDGEESYLEHAVPLEERQGISFPRLIELLDGMSRSSSEEYRDLDLERNEAADTVHHLGPVDYIRHLCSRSADETVQVKLKLLPSIEVTPKTVLIVSTGALMLFICVAIILGLALMWSIAASTQEKQTLRNFQGAVQSLVVTLERELLAQHTLALVDQGRIFAAWTEIVTTSEVEETTVSLALSSHRKAASIAAMHSVHAQYDADGALALDILARYERLGAPRLTDAAAGRFLSVINPPVATTTNCSSVSATRIPLTDEANSTLCVVASRLAAIEAAAQIETRRQAIDALNAANKFRDNLGGQDGNDWGAPSKLAFLHYDRTTNTFGDVLTDNAAELCVGDERDRLCDGVGHVLASLAPPPGGVSWHATGVAPFFRNETSLFAASVHPTGGFAFAVSINHDDYLQQHRMRTVQIVDHLNFNFIRSTEIVVALRDRLTREIIPQATQYRFDIGCYFECERFPPSTTNIRAGFVTKGFGWSITPDYRPEPVVGAFAHVGAGLDIVLCLERDVIEIRGLSFNFIVDIVNNVNALNSGSLELQLVGYRGVPLMKLFYAFEPCDEAVTDCVVDPRGVVNVNDSFGVVFRYDCKHCQRVTSRGGTELTLYTDPKKELEAGSAGATLPEQYRGLLDQQSSGTLEGRDYSGDESIAVYGFLQNYSVMLVAKVDRDEVYGPVNDSINLSVGCGVLFLVTGMVLLVSSSHRAFDAIENEWGSYKRQIEREQTRFATLVKGVIPPSVAERLMRGSKIIFDFVACASFTFVDLCGFSTLVKHWSAKHVARMATYCMAVMEETCQHCDITKLRSIGDLFTCVALREEKHKAVTSLHPVCRSMQLSCILMQLFSPAFAHFPYAIRAFRDVFKDLLQDNRPLTLPPIRIGVHCGPSVSGAFSIGSASHYDFFGIGPSLANRMQQTASPGRIHVTMMVKELLKTRDPDRCYIFDSARKTVVRGQGTITSYFVKAMTQSVPDAVLNAMSIRRAVERHELVPQRRGASADQRSNGSKGSRASYRSRRSSNHSTAN